MNKGATELQIIFDSLEDVMLIIDRDYSIDNINSSGLALLGKSREEVKGQKCYHAIHGETEPCEFCPFTQTLRTGEAQSIERYDESFGKHFCIKSTPMLDEHGEVARFVYSMSDTTERVDAEAKEKKLQQELSLTSRLATIGRVAAGVTHEINNPLTGVIAFAEMLMQMDVPENMKEAVEVIHDGANRVVGIVDKLLTFGRRDRAEKEYADINAIITNTLAMRSYEMRTNDVRVTTHLAADLPRTMTNVGQLQQVFLNIIINAEQAMTNSPQQGELTITTERVDDRIRVSVADNGPGIPEDVIDKLFDPFFTTRDEDGGTGLGLSISYGIIKEHGGEIHIRSVVGRGAAFIVDLPIIAVVEQLEVAEPPGKEHGELAGARILVVDDEPHICRALDRLLTQKGHRVEITSSPLVALEMLSEARYDLVLLDLKMPGMSGIELFDRMKDISPSLQQKVVCMTGDTISARNEAFLHQTGIPCVAKPFGVDELMRQVKLVLEGETKDAQVTYSHS